MKYTVLLTALLILTIGSATMLASSADTPYTLDRLLLEQVAFDLRQFAAGLGFGVQLDSIEFVRNERGFAAVSLVDGIERGWDASLPAEGRTLAAVYLDPHADHLPDLRTGHYIVQVIPDGDRWRVQLVDDWGRVRAQGVADRHTWTSRVPAEISFRTHSEGCHLVFRSPDLLLETWLS